MWKYGNLDETQLALLRQGTIDLGGEVNGDMALYVREAVTRLEAHTDSADLHLRLTSDGGDVGCGLSIYDVLRNYGGKKEGLVMGFARSMGVLILQACDRRIALQHSQILIHHISRREISLDVLRTKTKLQLVREEMEAQQTRLYKILSSRCGRTVPEIRKKCAEEQDMTAEDALEFGLIDEIK
jgi:ATP-dependent Clp protease protease subunit